MRETTTGKIGMIGSVSAIAITEIGRVTVNGIKVGDGAAAGSDGVVGTEAGLANGRLVTVTGIATGAAGGRRVAKVVGEMSTSGLHKEVRVTGAKIAHWNKTRIRDSKIYRETMDQTKKFHLWLVRTNHIAPTKKCAKYGLGTCPKTSAVKKYTLTFSSVGRSRI